MLDITAVQNMLPHRYPFLLIDRVLELESGRRVVALKNVTRNEEFFNGHYPDRPIMPGVLIIEAMAQAGGLAMLSKVEHAGKVPLFAGIDKARFRRTVVPGDQLRIEVEILRARSDTAKIAGKAFVGENELACEAELMFVVADPATIAR